MGSSEKIEAYRTWKGTPVPWDIDRYNQKSKDRNVADDDEAADGHRGPAGETGVPEIVRNVVSSPGQSLDESVQRTVEDRMGESLGDVRIHAGPRAAEAAEAIDARAFTVGNHIAFNHGEYDPDSAEGQHVLVHELAHVRQQTGGALSMLPQEDVALEVDPDPALEREAEETARRVMSGSEVGIQRVGDVEIHIQRRKYEKYVEIIKERDRATQEIADAPDETPTHPSEVNEPSGLPELGEISEERSATEEGVHRDVFEQEYPEIDDIVGEVHHAIEQQIIDPEGDPFFPGLIPPREMHSVENLRGIPEEIVAKLHRSVIRVKWNEIYKDAKFVKLQRDWMNMYKEYVYPNPRELSAKEAAARVDKSDVPKEMIELRDQVTEYLLTKVKEIDRELGEHFLPEMYTGEDTTDG